jgi:peptidoglycan/xylan/chitin deacetylase (PgdA/CDA1 family)
MINLMYHDIVTSDDKGSGFQNENAFMYKVNLSSFEEQVAALKDCDVKFTFDDGGESFITNAAPILEKYGKRGIFFISTKYIGTKGFLSKEQVKELYDRGHQIGSHSHTHPANISLLNKQDIYEEWKMSIYLLSEILGDKVSTASIPNGYDSKDVVDAASRVGIKYLYTSKPTDKEKQKKDVILYGRYVVHSSTNTKDVVSIVSSKIKRVSMYAQWRALEAIKLVLGNKYDKFKSFLRR